MADYIDRELVIKIIDEIWEDCRYQTIRKDVDENYHKHHKGRFSGVNRIRNVVLDAPAADVVSRETYEAVVKALQALAETDVVEVIRCGKCRHHLTRSGRCVKNEGIFSVSDFCSKGELK